MTARRAFLGGMAAILASRMAPASAGSGILMPVREIVKPAPLAMGIDWATTEADCGWITISGSNGAIYHLPVYH